MYLAYLDPGSGSMLAAAVVAGFAGAMVAVKMWWRRLTGKFRRQQPEQVAGEQAAAESTTTQAEGSEPAAQAASAEAAGRADRES
ncbi:hypothetical protein JQS43_20570 [Natronosporangium hydrolyticum]|uniref:Uncharacterized protein n=1 Tax=Natronosporangium hydrolyticum TaxID=2811111 RepID=A0A895YU50_9ACTN|nr:hypothetical protein [Natronosporangium hydrolyticum]QSB17588.1 hypothetical protein JQS43_20570 [Natronosporangium hydrolyticum]